MARIACLLVPSFHLVVRPRAEEAAQQVLLETAEAFSPRVEEAAWGLAYLDMDGCGDERASLRSLLRRCQALGLPARAGLAGCRVAAMLAARLSADEPTIVEGGKDGDFLAPLPLEQLSPDARTAKALKRWGIQTIGALCALPEAQLVSRLGEPAWLLRRLALGEDAKPLLPRRPPPDFKEGLSLDWGLSELEPFIHAAQGLVERLCARLQARGLACRELSLSLTLDPSGTEERAIALAAPTRDARTLLGLIRLELAARAPAAPVQAFSLRASPDRAREVQLSLFAPPAPSPDALSTTLARLAALLGPDRLGSPRPVSGHKPERFSLSPYDPPASPLSPPVQDGALERAAPFCAARVLRPELPLEVILGETLSPPRPVRVNSPELSGRVSVASGPWRVEEAWWGDAPVARDYWDVELDSGALYRIFLDRETGRWFADGVYD